MSTPKSVVKLRKKDGKGFLEYTSNCDAAQYYLFELSRAALRDVGKFLKREFNDEFTRHFPKRTGEARKATRYQVISGKKTIYPRLKIGLMKARSDGFYAYFQEFGTSKKNAYGIIVQRLGILQKVTNDNIAEIIKIESQYLSALSGEAERLKSMVTEVDMEDNDD